MSISRRNFIKSGTISVAFIAGSCLGAGSNVLGQSSVLRGADLPPEVYGDLLFSYHADTFSKFIGSPFSLFSEEFAEAALLDCVAESSFASRKKGKRIEQAENFMLSFRISNPEAKQATYTVIHGELGQFDLLLVPAQNERGEFLLNAVINRL